MKIKLAAAAFFLLAVLSVQTSAQYTYFIKYKSSVAAPEISEAVSKQRLPSSSSAPLNKTASALKISYLAKGLAKDIEPLSRIIRIVSKNELSQSELEELAGSNAEYVQRAVVYSAELTPPNDSLYADQWALPRIQAPEAWPLVQGKDTVLVAVIDTGIDYLHPDLRNKIYINKLEIGTDRNGRDMRSNGIDDDNNGFVDDFMGWDFTDRQGFPFDSTGGDYLGWDNDPMDNYFHGTYVAGILGASINNRTGIAGCAPNVKILNVRAFDPNGNGEEDDAAAAILYAVKMGAKVINMSFGDAAFSYVLRDVIRYAYSQGVTLVASSGNTTSQDAHYPSGYLEVICVGNSTDKDYIAGNSNYGSTLDLVAPGTSIVSTTLNNSYTVTGGTSASAPFVSAAAAMILSVGNYSSEEVKGILKSTADDIDKPGWDIRSGSGRLNVFRAMSVLSPSIVKFNFPYQDFTATGGQQKIRATIMSPYFQSFQLQIGEGITPAKWDVLVDNGIYQFKDSSIYSMDFSSLRDTVYTLRLLVNQINGKTLEERMNFYVDKTPPEVYPVSVRPAYIGSKSNILAEIYTNEKTIVKMYYRGQGESEFNYFSLDGFTTNNRFVKQLHYGFIPQGLVKAGTRYEYYFEAENLAGLKTILRPGNNSYYVMSTDRNIIYQPVNEQPYTLPAGILYKDPVSIVSADSSEIILNEYKNSNYQTSIYRLQGNSFVKTDSLKTRFTKAVGDFNNNGRTDIVSTISLDGNIDEQQQKGMTVFENRFSKENFYLKYAGDPDKDGITEVITSLPGESFLMIYKLSHSLTPSFIDTLSNFSRKDSLPEILVKDFGRSNSYMYPAVEVTDCNKDGRNEIWVVDNDGDVMSFVDDGTGKFRKGDTLNTGYISSSENISSGDFDGDGYTDIAVLLNSSTAYDIAPYDQLIVFNNKGGHFNILYEKAFIDQSAEYKATFRKVEKALRLADIDNDSRAEIILFDFPYSYIIENNDRGETEVTGFSEGTNSSDIFVGDLNKNGIPEVAFPTDHGIKFYEYGPAVRPSTPYLLNAFSPDSQSVYLSWSGDASSNKYYVLRGDAAGSLSVIDSVAGKEYTDRKVTNNRNYYYAVQAYDAAKPVRLSSISSIRAVYAHTPASLLSASAANNKNVIISFTAPVNKTIESYRSFEVPGQKSPSSVSPVSEKEYLLNFFEPLPSGSYSIVVKDLKDLYGSPIAADTAVFTVTEEVSETQFYISAYKLTRSDEIKITFNLPADQASALQKVNYSITPANEIISITPDKADKKTLYLRTKNPLGSVGREYSLHISNITSDESSGRIRIAEQSGSYIVISNSAADINNVYVYPNPVRQGTHVTFANLTRKAKIFVFSLSGEKINTLTENDGNGGIDWDMKDEHGNSINSGIYIFRVVSLDDENNESEQKLGKFAVIK